MKLKYRILWFEDDEEVIEDTTGPMITNFLDDLGFEADIHHEINSENLANLIIGIRRNQYDLIVTDLNLGEGYDFAGKALMNEIREGNILTEIVLYSASPLQIQQIRDSSEWVERASFCAGVPNLGDKLKSIIQLTVRKQQDVNNTRGLVIAETITLEKKIEKIIQEYFSAAEDLVVESEKLELLHKIRDKKLEQIDSQKDLLSSISLSDVSELIEKDILTADSSANAIISVLKKQLKKINIQLTVRGLDDASKTTLEEKKEKISSIRENLLLFKSEILEVRNTLAHVEEMLEDDGTPYLHSTNPNGTTIKFTNEKYVELRKDIRRHSSNLENILEHIY